MELNESPTLWLTFYFGFLSPRTHF